jgi:hypothetical protein
MELCLGDGGVQRWPGLLDKMGDAAADALLVSLAATPEPEQAEAEVVAREPGDTLQ